MGAVEDGICGARVEAVEEVLASGDPVRVIAKIGHV
jgi:hypothetical protein